MKTSRLLPLAALLCLLSLPALAQVNDTYVITASANTQGGFATRWLTNFSLFNPHYDYPLVVSITFMPTGGAQGFERTVEVPPNALWYSDDLLSDLDTSGSGALLIATFTEDNPGVPDTAIDRSFLVTSNTYNNSASGTYGQTIPGVWTGLLDYDTDGITSVAHGIRNWSRDGWRTNVGAVNLGRCEVQVLVSVYDYDGNTVLRDAPMNVPPFAHWQESLPAQVQVGSVEFLVNDPCAADDDLYAVVFPYTSTIDQYSGDPTYQTPTLLAQPGSLYAKAAAQAAAPGKKIDSAYARRVRENVEHRGALQLRKTEKGWQVAR